MEPRFTLIEDWVMVEPVVNEKVGSILLPENAREGGRVESGRVIAAGPGKVENGQRFDNPFRVGEVVMYFAAAVHHTIESKKYRFFRAGECGIGKDLLAQGKS